MIQAEGSQAVFLCQHPTDEGTIDWTLNGVQLRNINTRDRSIRTEGRGSATEALIISAAVQYNETEVVCITYIRQAEGPLRVEESAPATLTVQGELNP